MFFIDIFMDWYVIFEFGENVKVKIIFLFSNFVICEFCGGV